MRTPTSILLSVALVAATLVSSGCGPGEERGSRAGSKEQAITGGSLDTRHRNVAYLTSSFRTRCSAVLVAEEWVITAGHCVADILLDELDDTSVGATLPIGEASSVQVYFGGDHTYGAPAGAEGERYEGCEIVLHPELRMKVGEVISPVVEKDLALVRLCQPVVGIAPASLAETTVGLGTDVTLVGYGPTARERYDDGLRRSAQNRAYALSGRPRFVFVGPGNACQGDSGGAVFVSREGVEELTGVITNANCHWDPAKASGAAQSVAAAVYAPWIADHLGGAPPDLPPVGDALGFIGDPCADGEACASGQCFTESEHLFPEGACTERCTRFCPDAADKSTTFCVGVEAQGEERGYCVSRCDFARYPATGCRPGYVCPDDATARFGEPDVRVRVCWPDDLVGKGDQGGLALPGAHVDVATRVGCSASGGEATRVVPLALLLALFLLLRRRA